MKEPEARKKNIPSTMVLHKHLDGADTIFATMSGPLANNTLEKWIGVIIRGTYQSASEDSMWEYEPVYDLLPDIEPDSDSSNYGSSDEGSKDQENPYYQEQEELVLVPRSNPRRIRQVDQRALSQI